MDFLEELNSLVLCGDGAMGTELMSSGVPVDVCFEELNVSAPDVVSRIHDAYVQAGARLIETNTFGANAAHLSKHGLQGKVQELNYKTMRYPGHRDLMKFLLQDLNLAPRQDLVTQIFDQEVPLTDLPPTLPEPAMDAIPTDDVMELTTGDVVPLLDPEDLPKVADWVAPPALPEPFDRPEGRLVSHLSAERDPIPEV